MSERVHPKKQDSVTHAGVESVREKVAFGAAGSPGLRCATPENDGRG